MSSELISKVQIFSDEHTITNFFKVNTDLKDKIEIIHIKFALSRIMREELLSFAESTNYKHYLMIRTQLETGLRVNELINLLISDINFIENYITIQSKYATITNQSFKTKTKASNRIIPITNELKKEILHYLNKQKVGYVFLSNKGDKRYDKRSVIQFINDYAKKCESIKHNIGSHALRRTYASYLINDKKNVHAVEEISKLLGHSSIKTTMQYLFEITNIENFEKTRKSISKMNERRGKSNVTPR